MKTKSLRHTLTLALALALALAIGAGAYLAIVGRVEWNNIRLEMPHEWSANPNRHILVGSGNCGAGTVADDGVIRFGQEITIPCLVDSPLLAQNPHGGWYASNDTTGREPTALSFTLQKVESGYDAALKVCSDGPDTGVASVIQGIMAIDLWRELELIESAYEYVCPYWESTVAVPTDWDWREGDVVEVRMYLYTTLPDLKVRLGDELSSVDTSGLTLSCEVIETASTEDVPMGSVPVKAGIPTVTAPPPIGNELKKVSEGVPEKVEVISSATNLGGQDTNGIPTPPKTVGGN